MQSNVLLSTITIILALAVFFMFPALFVPSQVYLVVCGESVGTRYNCDVCSGIKTLFLYHCMVGMGRPSAMQYKNTLVSTLTVCGESGGSIVTLGASVKTYTPP